MDGKRKLIVTAEFHGHFIHTNRRPHDGKGIGQVEWPVSAFRLSCSVTCGADRIHEEHERAEAAVRKFMPLAPPVIHAAPLAPGATDVTRYVPHNHGDLMVKKGRPLGDDKVARHEITAAFGASKKIAYIYDIDEGFTDGDVAALRRAALSNNILGTGQDTCSFDVFTSDGEPERTEGVLRWTPRPGGRENPLRVHNAETYDDLQRCHESRSRCNSGPKGSYTERILPSCFNTVSYIPESDVPSRPLRVFRIMDPKIPGERKKFRVRNTTGVSAMTRHAANILLKRHGCNISGVDPVVSILGHSADGGKVTGSGVKTNRLSYIPIPSVCPDGNLGDVGHVIVAEGWGGDGQLAAWADGMHGLPLVEEDGNRHTTVATLKLVEPPSGMVNKILSPSRLWRSATPVVVDGWKGGEKFKKQIINTINNAGIPCGWFRVWAERVHSSDHIPVAEHLKGRKQVHMKIMFEHPVSGPICIGGARHYGIGLFVSVPENP